jgi:hypothetical protein
VYRLILYKSIREGWALRPFVFIPLSIICVNILWSYFAVKDLLVYSGCLILLALCRTFLHPCPNIHIDLVKCTNVDLKRIMLPHLSVNWIQNNTANLLILLFLYFYHHVDCTLLIKGFWGFNILWAGFALAGIYFSLHHRVIFVELLFCLMNILTGCICMFIFPFLSFWILCLCFTALNVLVFSILKYDKNK